MPRPFRKRRVRFQPGITHFKPAGIRLAHMDEVILNFEELEAIRLNDYEGLSQTDSAKKMNISQPTFARLIESARKKTAEAIVNGKAIRIHGGNYRMVQDRKEGIFAGSEGICTCIKCGEKTPHQRGMPCSKKRCPKCGSLMIRE